MAVGRLVETRRTRFVRKQNLPRLLVIDDDSETATLVTDAAESCGFAVEALEDPAEFLRVYADLDPDVILLEVMMPGIDSIELMRFLADRRARARILIFATADRRMMEMAVNLGRAYSLRIAGIINKPIQVEELRIRLAGLRD